MCSGVIGCVGKNSEREGKEQSQESERLEVAHVLVCHFSNCSVCCEGRCCFWVVKSV